jgi:DHA1 family inner membrane transport protein
MTDIEQSYAPRAYYPRLIVLAIGLFIVGTNAFVIAGLLPEIASSLHAQVSSVSYSITFYSITVAVAAPLVSIFLPRWSRTALMASGLVLISAGTVVAAASQTLEVFTIGRIVAALGGAALVPAATAAAAAIAPPERRGRAIAFVALGFTAATALGSPIGTAVGALGGWQVPLFAVAGLAILTAAAVAIVARGIPRAAPAPISRRFAPLRSGRVLMVLGATLFVTAGFNVVYIFSSAVTHSATGGSGSGLAVLLLVYGVAGTVGNIGSGQLVDRLGSRLTGAIFLATQVLVLVAMPFVAGNYLATALLFAVWGITAFAAVPPLQHRLIAVDPETSALALSWYTTAMYIGIALAPPLGAAAAAVGGPELIPVFGAASVAVALVVFLVGYAMGRVPRSRPSKGSSAAQSATG